MAVEVTIRKWGNSMGFVLPKEYTSEKNLKHGDKVSVEVIKSLDLTSIPKIKLKMSAQQMKDEARKGWE